MKNTGGRWSYDDRHCYFVASNVGSLEEGRKANDYLLVAVNEITDSEIPIIKQWGLSGKRVFIDSGVFNLANTHAVTHGISMDEALSLSPNNIDGFDELFSKYCKIIRELGDAVWGYIEVDQGGRENKKRTRARTEELGFKPIPVYHPLNDGWDYFDELAGEYDRICFGNIVQADRETRKRLLATAWVRRQKYPTLWIHGLGMTPNDWLNAYPLDSCDSSTWLQMVRWPASFRAQAALRSYHAMDRNFQYAMKSDHDGPTGHKKSRQLGGYNSQFMTEVWRAAIAEMKEQGCRPWPLT